MVGKRRSVEGAFWVSGVGIHQRKFSRWQAPVIGAVVAIYTRVSREDTEQPSSTRRQESACREFAQARGWDIVDVYEDIDVSAYDRRVRRPAFERLMRIVAGGQVNGVLVWKLDRLVRRSVDFERFWERCERAEIFLTSVTEPLDSSNEIGLSVVRMLVNFANVESTSISLRIRSKMQERARNGDPLLNGRAFGYTQGRNEVVEEEAAFIREAAERVLAGEQVASIVTDWNRRDVPTAAGALEWRHAALMRILRNPRLVGDNTYRGEVVARGCLPAILDRAVHAELCAVLASRRGPRRSPDRYLLSGLLRCQLCGARLVAAKRRRVNALGEEVECPGYKCPSRPTGCGRISIWARFVEELVTDTVLHRIQSRARARPDEEPPPDAPDQLTLAYERYSTSVRELAYDYYVGKQLTRDAWLSARDGIEHELNAIRRDLDPRWRMLPSVTSRTKGRLRAEWASLDLAHQRDIIASELESATVAPCPSSSFFFDPSRIRPKWWDESDRAPTNVWPKVSRTRIWSNDHWMSTKEAATLLRMSESAVFHGIRRGDLEAMRFGWSLRLSRDYVAGLAEHVAGAMSAQEAATHIGVSAATMTMWMKRGTIPAFRYAGHCYIQPDALNQWGAELGNLVSSAQVARQLGVSVGVVSKMVSAGVLHAIKCPKVAYLDRHEVEVTARDLGLDLAPEDHVLSV